jgi:peptide/nickel transport system substrate-binding protein
VSPAAVKQNAKGDDLAQAWLKTHDAGTGPYVLKEFVPASHYVLEAFDGYWGEKPYFKTVRIEVVPSIASQKLQLDQGDFDMIVNGLAIPDVKKYQSNSSFNVLNTVGGLGVAVFLNTSAGIFADQATRAATVLAVDRKPIVDTAWGGLATAQQGLWPPLVLDPKYAPLPTTVDTGPLKALVPKLASKKVDLAWSADGGAPFQQAAGLLQIQLSALGLDVAVRTIPTAEVYDLVNQPAAKRPDMLMAVFGGDALHLDSTLRILFRTGAKPVNFFQYSNPELDRLMDEAVRQPTKQKTNDIYSQCSRLIEDQALLLPLCVPPVSNVSHNDIAGIEPNSFLAQIFWPQAIKRT